MKEVSHVAVSSLKDFYLLAILLSDYFNNDLKPKYPALKLRSPGECSDPVWNVEKKNQWEGASYWLRYIFPSRCRVTCILRESNSFSLAKSYESLIVKGKPGEFNKRARRAFKYAYQIAAEYNLPSTYPYLAYAYEYAKFLFGESHRMDNGGKVSDEDFNQACEILARVINSTDPAEGSWSWMFLYKLSSIWDLFKGELAVYAGDARPVVYHDF